MQGISLTSKANEEISKSKTTIDHFFTIEDVLENDNVRKKLFNILRIY